MSLIWYKNEPIANFNWAYIYKGYVLVDEYYEDVDVRKTSWMWGKFVDGCIVDAITLKDLSSNSYAKWDEVKEVFEKKVDKMVDIF